MNKAFPHDDGCRPPKAKKKKKKRSIPTLFSVFFPLNERLILNAYSQSITSGKQAITRRIGPSTCLALNKWTVVKESPMGDAGQVHAGLCRVV